MNLLVFLLVVLLGFTTASEGFAAETMLNWQNLGTTRRLDGVVRQPLPLPDLLSPPPGDLRSPAIFVEPQAGCDSLNTLSRMELFSFDTGIFKPLVERFINPKKLLLAGVAGLNVKKGMLALFCPVGHGLTAFVAVKPVKSWSPPLIQEPTRKSLSVGAYLPLTDWKAPFNNLFLKISAGADQTMRPAFFITLITSASRP